MSKWYGKITANPDDLSPLVDAILYFEGQADEARKEIKLSGPVTKASAELPGVFEHRFRQYQEIEAILRYLEIRHSKAKAKAFKSYLEGYNRSLSSRDAEKYAEADDDVVELALLINQVALVRNEYQGIIKGFDIKQWQIGNLVKLKVAGFEDFEID